VSGPEFLKIIVEYLSGLGSDVIDLGICPTPTVSINK
jgi:phosphomannomutase